MTLKIKATISTLILLISASSVFAQELLITPQTSIDIKIRVKKEVIEIGRYSRYSSKLVGLQAPLNNKITYSIEGVSISSINYNGIEIVDGYVEQYNKTYDKLQLNNKEVEYNSATETTDISLFPMTTESGILKSDAELAEEVAETIFTIREKRFSLITGNYEGEGAYGAGLGAAIKEMNRLEGEYIKLFIGKSYTEYETYSFKVTPSADKTKYIVCRMSDSAGIVPNIDISGEPIILVLKDLNTLTKQATESKGRKNDDAKPISYPDLVKCSIFVGTNNIATQMFEMFQFGETF